MKKRLLLFITIVSFQILNAQFDSLQNEVIANRTLEIKKYDSALNAFKNGIQDSVFQYIFYYEKSWNFIRDAKYDSSYYFAEKGLHMAIQRNDTAQLVSFYKQLGICYYYNFQKEKAKNTFIKGLSFRNNKVNQHNIAALYNNLGGIYTEFNKLDSAEYYLKNAIKIFEKLDSTSFGNVLQSKRVLATVYFQDKKNNQAKELLLEVLKSASRVNHPVQKTAALVYLSSILEDEGRYLAALEYTREAYKIQLAEDNKDAMLVTVGKLCNNFDKLNLIDSAYHYLQIQNSLRIEVYTDNISDNISKLEVEFETQRAKTEKKIAIQNELNKSLELEVSEKNNRIIIGTGVIIFLILISIALFFYSQKRIQKTQAEKQIQLERTQAIIEGEEQERERLSRELHDGVGQLLAGVKLNLNAIGIRPKHNRFIREVNF
jgi:tetratricopeptide (TPR) repeat protein